MQTFDITVKYRCGAYETGRIRNACASSTMSARAAAERMGEKLFGEHYMSVENVTPDGTAVGMTRWRIFASTEA